jgi:hypothetical protein
VELPEVLVDEHPHHAKISHRHPVALRGALSRGDRRSATSAMSTSSGTACSIVRDQWASLVRRTRAIGREGSSLTAFSLFAADAFFLRFVAVSP